jgi:Sel1 repeat
MGARAETAVLMAAIVVLGSTPAWAEGHSSGQNMLGANVAPINVVYQNDTAAAFSADRSGNYAEALRLFLKLDAEGQASGPPANLAGARERIGEYYEKGLGGVTQNYSAAASWYEKAISGGPSIRASIRLGFLYANGLGRPQDRAKAREMFKSIGPSSQIYITLLDHNMLPKSDEDIKRSDFEKAKKARDGAPQQEGVPPVGNALGAGIPQSQQPAANNGSAYTFKCDTGAVHPEIVTVDTNRPMMQLDVWGDNTGLKCTTTVVNGAHAPLMTGPNAGYCAWILNMWNGGENTSAQQIVIIRQNVVHAFALADGGVMGEFHLDFTSGIFEDGNGHVAHCRPQHDIRE